MRTVIGDWSVGSSSSSSSRGSGSGSARTGGIGGGALGRCVRG